MLISRLVLTSVFHILSYRKVTDFVNWKILTLEANVTDYICGTF